MLRLLIITSIFLASVLCLSAYLVDAPSLDAQSVLVDCDDLLVEQDGFVIGLDGAEVH